MSQHLAKDLHTAGTALAHVAFYSAQLAWYTGVGIVQGTEYLLSDSPPDRSEEVPFDVSYVDGVPVVRWVSEHGNEFAQSWHDYWYEVVTMFQLQATVSPAGQFIVTRQPLYAECRWKAYDTEHGHVPESVWGMPAVEPVIEVLCDLPVTTLRSFTPESSGAELHASDAAKLQAGRLIYTQHTCIRAAFVSGENGIISYCQRGSGFTNKVAYALNRLFTGTQAPRGLPQQRRSDPI